MTRKIIPTIFLIFFSVLQLAAQEQNFRLDGLAEPSSYIHGCVNAITGSFMHSFSDIIVDGPEALSFTRHYCSSNTRRDHFGYGFTHNHPTNMDEVTYDAVNTYLSFEESGGSRLRFCAGEDKYSYDKNKKGWWFHFLPAQLSYGVTNCAGGQISAKTNTKNTKLFIKKSEWSNDRKGACTAILGDGTYRFYKLDSEMSREVRPSGNQIRYEYGKKKQISKIVSTDASGNITMGWIKIDFDDKENQVLIKASNGKEAVHTLDKHRCKSHRVTGQPDCTISYKHHTDLIEQINWQDNGSLKLSYDHKKINSLYLPNSSGELLKAYGIEYHTKNRYTQAIDLYGGKTIYAYTKEKRLKRRERFHKDENGLSKLHSIQKFYWGNREKYRLGKPIKGVEGNLTAKGLADEKNNLLTLTHYQYDSIGNILQETIVGHLTGVNKPVPITVSETGQPALTNVEHYRKHYTYSNDDYNLVLTMREDDGTGETYAYLPNSDKLTKKLIHANGEILSREFFEYNHLGVLTKHIIDDGCALEQHNLHRVTQQLITTIVPNVTPEMYGFGKPGEIIESYWDPKTRSEHLLKRVKYTYGIYDLVTEESYYDSNNEHRYTLHYSYDQAGNRTQETDPLGRVTVYRYDSGNHCIHKEKLGSCFYTHYIYDRRGRCIKTEERHQSGETFTSTVEYDLFDRKIATVDPFGNRTTYIYDDLGRLIQTNLPPFEGEHGVLHNPVEKKFYNIWDQVVTEIDPAGNAVHKQYNCRGQTTEVLYPDGTAEKYFFNLNGTLLKKTQKNGSYAVLAYDPHKRLIREDTFSAQSDHLRSHHYGYEGKNLVVEIDSAGTVSEYRYDGAGRKTAQIRKGGSEQIREEYFYDSLGQMTVARKWYGMEAGEYIDSINTYNLIGHLVQSRIEDSFGNVCSRTRYDYDVNGNKIQETREQSEGKISVTSTEYTSYNLPIKTIDPLGNATYLYNDFGYVNARGQNVLKSIAIDPLGIRTISIKDPYGRDVSIRKEAPAGELLASEKIYYDIRGFKIAHISDAIANGATERQYTIRWCYDSMARPVAIIEDPEGKHKITKFSYTPVGTIQQKTKPDGVVLFYEYDSLGRETSLKSSDNTVFYTYRYDLNDHLLESIDQLTGHALERKYDPFGNLIYEKLPNGLTTAYTFDYYGRITQCRLHEGTVIAYDYGPTEMRSVSKLQPDGTVAYTHYYDQTDWNGRSLVSTLITGEQVAFDWDPMGRLKSMHCPHASQAIPASGYDPMGNLLEVEYRGPWGSKTDLFKYDPLCQLSEEDTTCTHQYRNDSLNNRLALDQISYRLNALNQIESDGLTQYYYDQNGNLYAQQEADGSRIECRYDALNRLQAVFIEEQWRNAFSYDSFGRCIQSKTERYQTGWQEEDFSAYLYQGLHEIGSADREGKIHQLRIMGKMEGPAFRVSIAFEIEGNIYAPLYDQRFNVVCLVDSATRESFESYRYSAYGHVSVYDFSGNLTEGTAINNPWLFGNKRYHEKIKLYNFGKRFYRPEIGRWITPDPADFVDGLNLYAYTRNGPMSNVDFYGFFTQQTGLYPVNGGLVQGLSPESFENLGVGIEALSTHCIPEPNLQHCGEGLGRMLQGKSFHHPMTALQPSVSGAVGEESLGKDRVRYCSGIMTTPEGTRQGAQMISNELQGAEVQYSCHPTKGGATDLKIAAYECLNIEACSLNELRNEILNDYNVMKERFGEDFSLHYIVHSRGALEFYLMTQDLPKEIKGKMNVYAIGPARLIPKRDFQSAVNFCNTWDPVPVLGIMMQYLGSPLGTIKETFFEKTEVVHSNHVSDGPLLSRMLNSHLISTGYAQVIKDVCRDINKRRGGQ